MRILQCGDEAILVEVDNTDQVLGLHRSLLAVPPPGMVECVPAARTVLIMFDPARITDERLAHDVAARRPAATSTPPGELVEIPVRYDGSDLADVAQRIGLRVEDIVALHTRPTYVVAFCGFAPGFGYLTGLPPALWLPRRDSPRVRVGAGAVAIADRFSGVYPRPAPGGWHILGHTDTPMWTLDRESPALLRPGRRVRFVASDGHRTSS